MTFVPVSPPASAAGRINLSAPPNGQSCAERNTAPNAAGHRNAFAKFQHTGTSVSATVSDKGYTTFRESDRILTSVTFTFTDGTGTPRWVQRHMAIHASSTIVDGQQTRLWYDATDPGNDSRVTVELANEWPLRGRSGNLRADTRRLDGEQ
ncbi:MAG: hypothetical protein WAW17_02135 [Rhodococcus sp. (in: high G+C Gram-positive bacteria)]|uniref:hypothetical protein n=1 Tax=Rhodococcus sp. TaxID=1831 RepID=UPI003BAF5B7E